MALGICTWNDMTWVSLTIAKAQAKLSNVLSPILTPYASFNDSWKYIRIGCWQKEVTFGRGHFQPRINLASPTSFPPLSVNH